MTGYNAIEVLCYRSGNNRASPKKSGIKSNVRYAWIYMYDDEAV